MTRLALLSDIHGNLPALEAVIADLAVFKPDQVVVAGDIVNWGPFSAECLDRVLAEGWAVMRGNNEWYITDYRTPRAPEAWNHFTFPPWVEAQLGERRMRILASLPDTLSLRFRDASSVRVVHGSPRSHFESIHPLLTDKQVEEILSGVEETTVFSAHSHLAMDRTAGRWHIINSGTVGVPLMGSQDATYTVLDSDADGWRVVAHRQVRYDPTPLFEAFERRRFVEECGALARLVIREFETARLHVVPFFGWMKHHHPSAPMSEEMVELYSRDSSDMRIFTPPEYHSVVE